MLSELFYWVLNMSIIGSVTGLLVLSLRQIKALPRLAIYVLWVLPLIRFWLPFGIANEYSLLTLISRYTTKTVVIWKELPQFTTTNSIIQTKGQGLTDKGTGTCLLCLFDHILTPDTLPS